MRTLGTAALVLLLTVGGCGLSRHPGTQETDRIARVVAEAISYPRQPDAVGLARAAAATRAAESGELTVVEARDLTEEYAEAPTARLVFRIHLDAVQRSGFSSDEPAVTACYDVVFHPWGMEGSPQRRECPAGASAVPLPPPAPVQEISPGSDAALRRAIRALPDEVVVSEVAGAVRGTLPAVRPGALDPEVTVEAEGGDVGVSVRASNTCLLGVRLGGAGGRVLVWRPDRRQMQAGELSCVPVTALQQGGVTPPH